MQREGESNDRDACKDSETTGTRRAFLKTAGAGSALAMIGFGSNAVSAASSTEIWLEAENASYDSASHWTTASDTNASGGTYLAPTDTSDDPATLSFETMESGSGWVTWARLKNTDASSDGDDDNIEVALDDDDGNNVYSGARGTVGSSTSTWTWVKVEDGHSMPDAGAYTLTIDNDVYQSDVEVGIDKFYITNTGNTPSGTGGDPANNPSDDTAPTTPSNLSTANATTYSVDLSWDASSDSESGVDHYNVYVDGELDRTVPAGTTSTTVNRLPTGSNYDFAVEAVDKTGNVSSQSTANDSTTGVAPPSKNPPLTSNTEMPVYGHWEDVLIGAGGVLLDIHTTPANENVIYATTDVAGVFRSDDRGHSWYVIRDGMGGRCFSVDPRDEDTVVYADGEGLWRSTDVAGKYQDSTVSEADIWTKVIDHPRDKDTSTGFMGSNGDGRACGDFIARKPDNDDVLIAPAVDTIFKSTDGGATWTDVGAPAGENVSLYDVKFDPHNPSHVYLCSNNNSDWDSPGGLYKSTDAGATWSKLMDGGDHQQPAEILFDPSTAGTIYGLFDYGSSAGHSLNAAAVKRSTDSGSTWNDFETGLPASDDGGNEVQYGSLATDGTNVYLGASMGLEIESKHHDDGVGSIYSLPAGGSSWSRHTKGGDEFVDYREWEERWQPMGAIGIDQLNAIAFDEADPNAWYCCGGYALAASEDGGVNWQYSSHGIEEMVGLDIYQGHGSNGYVHAGIADAGYFRLTNDGQKLDKHVKAFGTAVNNIATTPADPNVIYGSTVHYSTWQNGGPLGRIIKSTNQGDSWDAVEDLQAGNAHDLPTQGGPWWYANEDWGDPAAVQTPTGVSVNPTDANHIVLGMGNESYVWESTDGGANFSKIDAPLESNTQGNEFNANFWMGNSELELSGDGSMVASLEVTGPAQAYDPSTGSWSTITLPREGNSWHVARDANTNGKFMLTITDMDGGVYESTDGGQTWSLVVPQHSPSAEYDPNNSNRVAVTLANYNFPLLSLDGGSTFVRTSELPAGGGDHLTFAGDNLIMGSGGASYFLTDVSQLENSTSAPPAPSNLSVSEHTGSTVTLDFDGLDIPDDTSKAFRYEVYVTGGQYGTKTAVPLGDEYSESGAYVENQWTDRIQVHGLDDAVSYTFEVTAVDANGNESAATNSVSQTTDDHTAPPAPSNLSVDSYDYKSITVSWDPVTDAPNTGNQAGVDHYNVYVENLSASEDDVKGQTAQSGLVVDQQVLAGTTSATVADLERGDEYEISVTAVDAATDPNESQRSSIIQRAAHRVALDAPQEIDPDSGTSDVVVLTTESVDASNVDTATIQVGAPSAVDGGTAASPSSTSLADEDMDSDDDLVVTADNSAMGFTGSENYVKLEGQRSDDGTRVVGYSKVDVVTSSSDTTAPTAPSNLSSSAHDASSVDLNWDASSDSGTGVDHYNVYVDGTKDHQVAAGTTSTTVSGLSSGTSYDFHVTAVDGAGNESSASNTVTVTTDSSSDTTAPAAPSNLSSPAKSDSSVDLDWDASSDDGTGVDHYNVYVDGTKDHQVAAGTTSTTVSNLSSETSYDFHVTAVDGASNESAASGTVTVTTDSSADTTAPTAPSNLSSPSHGSDYVDLDWDASSDTGGSGLGHYNVYVDGVKDHQVAAGTTSTTVSNLSSSTSYDFYVTAVDGAGNESSASNTVTVTTDSGSSTANPIATDPFDVTAAPLDGVNSGTGWAQAWHVQNSDTTTPGYEVRSGSLSYSTLATSGNHAIGGRAWLGARRELDTSSGGAFDSYLDSNGLIGADGTTLYVSVLLRKDQDDDEASFVFLGNDGDYWSPSGDDIQLGYLGSSSNSGGSRYWTLSVAGSTDLTSQTVSVGTTSLLVAKIEFGSTNTVSLYVDPDLSSEPSSPDAQLSTSTDLAFSHLVWDPGDHTEQSSMDEIRFGDSYADVTPTN